MSLSRAMDRLFGRPWQLAAAVALISVPLLIVSEISSRGQRDQLRDAEQRSALSAAESAAATFADHVLAIRNGLVQLTFGTLSTNASTDRSAAIDVAFTAHLTMGDEVLRLYVLDAQRLVYVAVPGAAGTLFGKPFERADLLVTYRPAFDARGVQLVNASAQTRISQPYRGAGGSILTVISAARQEWPTVVAQLDLTRVAERIAPQLPMGDVYVVDGSGLLLLSLSSDSARVGQLASASRLGPATQSERAPFIGSLSDPETGRPLLTATAFVPETDWRLVVARPSTFASDVDPVLTQVQVGRIAFVLVLLVGSVLLGVAGSQIVRQRQALAHASQEKSRFLANMSHELRTPLNAIIGFAQLLEDGVSGPLSARQSDYLRDISESGRHQLALINDILDLSKVEAGKMDFRPERFDASEAIRRVQTLVAPLAQSKSVRMRAEGDTPLQIEHDPARFRQVLYNLLSNAVKFTPEGGSVTAALRADGEGWMELAVSDTGVGISAEDQASIFQEFKRVGSSYAQAQLGTGLGLALVKRLVEGMGGQITVASAEGEGSTFTVRLPQTMPPG